jgi:hypothetical protein
METELMIGCAIYIAGAWATALTIGYMGLEDNAFFIFVESCSWPLFWILMVFIALGDKIEEIMDRDHENRAQVVLLRIGNVLSIMTIMFRPYSAGRMLREWYEGRSLKRKAATDE